ncbi:IGF-like family receptor 1 [Solea senegalensis]|uniref:IGF-like family receptor 1 n=1 Tax=Solea senegalensis TaxID=28829 RepID=A0AAV6PSY2_SOLSE|nr:IGF-like family receptor 1 [Solea senegalensis]
MEERHSDRCGDLTTRLDRSTGQCVPCIIKPGYEVTPNCGFDDHGGRHESPFRECRDNTYNDGSRAHCHPCTPCPSGYFIIGSCNSTTDTQCRSQKTSVTTTYYATSTGQPDAAGVQWEVPVILISIILVLLSACIIYKKWTRGRHRQLCYRRKSSIIREGFFSFSAPAGNSDLDAILKKTTAMDGRSKTRHVAIRQLCDGAHRICQSFTGYTVHVQKKLVENVKLQCITLGDFC